MDPIIKKFKLSDLERASYNPRKISDEAAQGLRESLRAFGAIDIPVVNVFEGRNRLVSGHRRVESLMAEGVVHADCLAVSFDDMTEKLANLSMNNVALQGTYDTAKAFAEVERAIKGLPQGYAGFGALRDDLQKQVDRLVAKQKTTGPASDNTPTGTPDGEDYDSVDGTTYELGRHRLFCGSFEAGVTRLASKKNPFAACITDPPYNVAYEGAAGSIDNDDMGEADWSSFIASVANTIIEVTDGPCAVFIGYTAAASLGSAWVAEGGVILRWCWWVKDRFTLSRSDYHNQHEIFLYGCRSGVVPKVPNTARSNAIVFPRPSSNPLHPTMKPVGLIKLLMEDLTEPGDLVFEPFAGSGTTLVVAEETGRTCYACELSPKFCDVVRKRYAEQVHGADCDWRALTPALSAP